MTPQTEDRMPGSVVTLYSYKGGVGRSMATANLAILLTRRGLRVLAVDWDLEAPGLERYFHHLKQSAVRGGLLPYLSEAKSCLSQGHRELIPQLVADSKKHTWRIIVEGREHPLALLPSGRASLSAKEYQYQLQSLDWRRFFDDGGGDLIEALRNRWREEYDIVLIDSRTGLSDSGGICTIQLPDVLVAMFTANQQSIQGISDVIGMAKSARQTLAYDRMALTVLPIACRLPKTTELEESRSWMDQFSRRFEGVCDEWLPRWFELRMLFEHLSVPQVDWFNFGERLAVEEQGTTEPGSMGYVFDRMADLLSSGFDDLQGAFGTAGRRPANWTRTSQLTPGIQPTEDEPYSYDVFISYAGGGRLGEWTTELVELLREAVGHRVERPVRVFYDLDEIKIGDHLERRIDDAVVGSRVFIALISPAYVVSEMARRELDIFMSSHAPDERKLIPILLDSVSPKELPLALHDFNHMRISTDHNRKQHTRADSYRLYRDVERLADAVATHLRDMESSNTGRLEHSS